MTVSEVYPAFEAYYLINNDRTEKTISEYRGRLFGRNGFVTIIGDIPVNTLGIDHIVAWKIHLRDEGLQASYINDMLSSLRWFIKWCNENEYPVIDWQKIAFEKEEKNKPKSVLSPEEIQRLVDCAPTLRDKAIIRLFFDTGCRSAEELNLDRDQWEVAELVNEEQGIWEFWVMGKNKKYRPVLMTSEVKDTVDLYLSTRKDRFKPLFISQQNRRISYHTVSRMLHATAAKAGLTKRVTQHIIRHSYATERGANGMPMPVLAYNLGHTNAATTAKIYTHINTFHARRAYAQSYPSRNIQPKVNNTKTSDLVVQQKS